MTGIEKTVTLTFYLNIICITDEDYYQEQELKDIQADIKDEAANLYGYGFGWRRSGVLGWTLLKIFAHL